MSVSIKFNLMSDRGEETRDCGNENRKDIRYRLEDLRGIINDAFLFLFSFLKHQSSGVFTFCPDDFLFRKGSFIILQLRLSRV